jgi:undecaprenyl-diphosphatase
MRDEGGRCRAILAVALLAGFLGQLFFLAGNCPIDLSGDEAHYWDWSRQLDLSYYSKGPLVAYIIRASCAVLGDTMLGVRLPALVLGVATSIVTYLLTRKLFGSERLALGAVLLGALVPMFHAGSFLMTIDPPFVFAWALATYLLAIAVFDERRWAWPVIGIVIGLGALAKYAALLWLPIAILTVAIDPQARKQLATLWPWIACLIALACMTPVIVWNARHDWVSFAHVAGQLGAANGNPLEFVALQVVAVGPTLAVIMIGAIAHAIRSKLEPNGRQMIFLITIGGAFFLLNLLDSFFTKVQVNWPAPAYFTLLILCAYFLSTRLSSPQTWRPWRGWFYASVAIGLLMIPIARDRLGLFPLFRVATLDPLVRLRGWRQLADAVAQQRETLAGANEKPDDVLILCDDYQQTALTAFYVPGSPQTYCAGPYFGKRMSQYDMWPDRRLHDNPALIGRNAVYVGKGGALPAQVEHAFARVERLEPIPVVVRGVEVKSFKLWRGYDFRGMPKPTTEAR